MSEAVIGAAARSAIGKKKGSLAATRADDLLANLLGALVERAKLDPKELDDVVTGCVTQIGEQGFNVARTAALMAGFPVEVTGTTVNRQCGSSQQAFHFATQAVLFSLITFQPSTRFRRNTTSIGIFGSSLEMSPEIAMDSS